MAKKKADLIAEAQTAGLDVGQSHTVAQIKAALKEAAAEPTPEQVLKTKKQKAKKDNKSIDLAQEDAGADKNTKETKEDTEASERKAAAAKRQQRQRRSRLERRGKQYRKAHELLDKTKEYGLDEALELLPKTSFVKFDAAVEMHVNLGIDPKQADQTVRASVTLPHGSGKSQRVAVLADAKSAKTAQAAGADLVGDDDLLEQIKQEKFDFDILVTTPDMMPKLGKHAKQLGPRGLMPNPKSGTVTNELAQTVKALKSGRIEFRNDAGGIIHQVVGRLSFKPDQLKQNILALLEAVKQSKPTSLKGTYIERIYLTTSMGPAIKLSVSGALEATH